VFQLAGFGVGYFNCYLSSPVAIETDAVAVERNEHASSVTLAA